MSNFVSGLEDVCGTLIVWLRRIATIAVLVVVIAAMTRVLGYPVPWVSNGGGMVDLAYLLAGSALVLWKA